MDSNNENPEPSINVQSLAHNGKRISLVSVSPNGTYIVTFSEKDKSIEGWIVNKKDSKWIRSLEIAGETSVIKVNDNKICATKTEMKIFKMSNKHDPIKLNPPIHSDCYPHYACSFKKNGNLVIFHKNKIFVYSSHNEASDELILTSSYKLYSDEPVKEGIIEDNKIWAISSNYLFQWNLETLQLEFSYSLGFTVTQDENFTIRSKGNLILVKCHNEIAIFSKEIRFPIRHIRIEGSIIKVELLCEANYLLVFNLPKEDEKQNINLYHTTEINKRPVDASKIFNENGFILHEYDSELKKAFGLVNRRVSSIDLSNLNWHEFFEFNHVDDDVDVIGWNTYLYQTSNIFPDMENIRSLFSNETKDNSENIDIDFDDQKYKWRIDQKHKKVSICNLFFDTNKEVLIHSKYYDSEIFNWKILSNNSLALRNENDITIYKYDIDNKNIKIQYYFDKPNIEEFYGSRLPMANIPKSSVLNFQGYELESIIEDDRSLAKYGSGLLSDLIKSTDPSVTSYIEMIYGKCTKLVKDDPKRNLKFLNVITLSMKDLYERYPDYITKFNSEMFMFLDPFNEKIIDNTDNPISHFFTFSQEIEISEITKIKYFSQKIMCFFRKIQGFFKKISGVDLINFVVPLSPLYKAKQTITLIVPCINYSCYPLKYSLWKEIIYPQPSVFINTCKKEFYTNWNSEAIISFKWKKFGRRYYFIILLKFIIFIVCFTIASYPTNYITRETRIKLYQTSIFFGFLHLVFEVRQLVWNPKRYFLSIWNWFDLSAYFSAIITSIYWIKYDNTPDWSLSISCLLLDLKFLLFFRIFESFGVYFAIMFGVATRVFSFLVVLALIIASFAHAFFLLLHPQNLLNPLAIPNRSDPNDPNNPWTLSNTYNQIDENGNISNETLIQKPSENTNLFYSYHTSLLATYLFLTGNQNSLSAWAPTPTTENTILFVLMALFSFLVVIYLMNLFIGLLNMAIEKDNDRASYLVQKAEIIAEIELFYLLPHQRRWRTWFPEVINYTVDIEKARIYIKEAINKGDWKMDDWPGMKYKILKLLSIEDIKNNHFIIDFSDKR